VRWTAKGLLGAKAGARLGGMATKEHVHQLVDAMPDGPETESQLDWVVENLEANGIEPGTISPERKAALAKLASYFEHPETAPWDWEELREGKLRAWPVR